jgi:hypothetical protein
MALFVLESSAAWHEPQGEPRRQKGNPPVNNERPLLPLVLRWITVGALLAVAALGACGDDDGGSATATPGQTSAPSRSGPGSITITSGPIAGQANKVLLISAAPQTGGAPIAEACVQIKSDRFAVPATVMTDKKASDQAPCSGSAAKTTFPEGTYTVTAGVYAPPAQAPEKEVKLTVQVKGDATIQIDAAALSR